MHGVGFGCNISWTQSLCFILSKDDVGPADITLCVLGRGEAGVSRSTCSSTLHVKSCVTCCQFQSAGLAVLFLFTHIHMYLAFLKGAELVGLLILFTKIWYNSFYFFIVFNIIFMEFFRRPCQFYFLRVDTGACSVIVRHNKVYY